MRTVKLSYACTGSAVGRKPVFGLRLQQVDRVRPIGCWRPLRVAAPGGHLTRGAPALASLHVTRGRCGGIGRRAGRTGREVRVLLDLHGFSFTALKYRTCRALVPGPASERPAVR